MPLLALDVMKESRTLLNDTGANLWTNVVLLPYLQRSYNDLARKLQLNSLRVIKEVSGEIVVPALTRSLTLAMLQPDNLLDPVSIGERNVGSEDRYSEMMFREEIPDFAPEQSLKYWSWNENDIQFIGASQAREILIRYRRALGVIQSENSLIEVLNAQSFLASRTAYYAAGFGGSATVRANELRNLSAVDLDDLIRIEVKQSQNRSVRRRRFMTGR